MCKYSFCQQTELAGCKALKQRQTGVGYMNKYKQDLFSKNKCSVENYILLLHSKIKTDYGVDLQCNCQGMTSL